MNFFDRLMPIFVVSVLLLGAGTIVMRWIGSRDALDGGVTIPKFSALAAEGKTAFDANCAQCHGRNSTGTDKGPPLVHDIYNPGHHNDRAFFRAAKRGAPQHHWPFGNMPPQPQMTDAELAAIVRYIREIQEANGIFYRSHTM